MTRRIGTALLLLTIAPVLASCDFQATASAASGPASLDHAAHRPLPLKGAVLNASDRLAAPTELEVLGDRLVLIDSYAEQVVKTLRRGDGAIERAFGRRGQGPGEFEGAYTVDTDPESPDVFWVQDYTLQRLTRVDLRQQETTAAGTPGRVLKLHGDASMLDAVRVGDGFVTLGMFAGGRLGFVNGEGKLVRTAVDLPLPDMELPAHVRQHAYQSRLKPNPSRTLLAVATRHADRLEIFRTDGARVAEADRLFGFEPVFEVTEGGGKLNLATGENLRFGYIDVTTTDDHIFALFSGRTRAGHPGEANFARFIHVFDWSGRLLKVLQLDASVIALTTDPAGTMLYAVRHDPTPAILVYRLPDKVFG